MCKLTATEALAKSNGTASSMKNAAGDNTYYALAGNAAHVLTLISTVSFAWAVATKFHDEPPEANVFDSSWRENGFCVTNVDVPYWNSHDACLYFDTVAGIVLAVVYWFLSSAPGMELANGQMKMGIPGIVAHGLGHGAVGAAMRTGQGLPDDPYETGFATYRNMESTALLASQVTNVVFWLCLLKASMPNVKNGWIVLASAASIAAQLFVPQIFGFTYVQTVLMIAFSVNQLLRDVSEKDFHYALYPAMVGFPLTLIGWMESTQCTSFVKDSLYGHLAYDGYIPLSMLGWYLACYLKASAAAKTSSTKKKKTA